MNDTNLDPNRHHNTHEIGCQLALLNVFPFDHSLSPSARALCYLPRVVMVTVSRQKLQSIYRKTASRSLPISFQIYLESGAADARCYKITSVHYGYGKKTTACDNGMVLIEDPAGCRGSADLHVWGYVHPQLVESGVLNNYVGVVCSLRTPFPSFRLVMIQKLSTGSLLTSTSVNCLSLIVFLSTKNPNTSPESLAISPSQCSTTKKERNP